MLKNRSFSVNKLLLFNNLSILFIFSIFSINTCIAEPTKLLNQENKKGINQDTSIINKTKQIETTDLQNKQESTKQVKTQGVIRVLSQLDSGKAEILNFPASGESKIISKLGDTGADYTNFLNELNQKIKQAGTSLQMSDGNQTVVRFNVNNKGEQSNLRIIQSSGDGLADRSALNAIINAAPFKHLPEGSASNLTIEFTF